MRWHYRLGHASFATLKKMAQNGKIPKRFAKVLPPKCAGCLFGAMTKIPWRGKESKSSHEVFVATKPGECVSVDQMVSTQVGFYAQMTGKLTTRRYLIFGIIFSLALRQVNFVMAYPQAPIEEDIYMEIPQGIKTAKGKSKDTALKLLKNIYGQKQAGRVWNSYLVQKLESIGFHPSQIDDCVFFRDDVIFMVYVDDGIFIGNDDKQLQDIIKEIQGLGLNIEDQGHPADYVGVSIKKLNDGSYEFTQRALIDSIIKDVGLMDSKTKPVLAKVSLRLRTNQLSTLTSTTGPQ